MVKRFFFILIKNCSAQNRILIKLLFSNNSLVFTQEGKYNARSCLLTKLSLQHKVYCKNKKHGVFRKDSRFMHERRIFAGFLFPGLRWLFAPLRKQHDGIT